MKNKKPNPEMGFTHIIKWQFPEWVGTKYSVALTSSQSSTRKSCNSGFLW